MANTFEEQARDRFTKSLKFMEKAETLLDDDLLYRSALADAVSSIKNMLQGYLLLRVAATPASSVTQRWQEIAASNRMPELIAACGEADLDLRGLAVDIRHLNTDRNNRAHDDPQRRIEPDEAAHAIETAHTLQRRIKAAVQGRQEVRSLPHMAAQAASVVRAAASGQLRAGVANAPAKRPALTAVEGMLPAPIVPAPSGSAANGAASAAIAEPSTTAASASSASTMVTERPPTEPEPPAQATSSAIDALDDSGEGDTSGELPTVSPRRPKRRRRAARVLLRILVAAVLLLVGIAAGIGVTVPVASGHAPGWLSFATRLLPTAPASTPITAVASSTPDVTTVSRTVGSLTISAPTCAAGSAMLTLVNSGNELVAWSVGSPDAVRAVFAASAGETGVPSLAGTLLAGASATIYAADPGATGPYSVVVVATGGAVQLVAPSC